MMRPVTLLAVILCLGGFLFLGQAGYLTTRAMLAQALIGWSWNHREPGQEPARPWPWADIRVAARLHSPRIGESVYVMQDAGGEALAFGPGVVFSDRSRQNGAVVIAGHRDTHFRFLADLEPGDQLVLEGVNGVSTRYSVLDAVVFDSRDQLVLPTDVGLLGLVTCWPFDAVVPGGPLRYLVTAGVAEPTRGI
jgi:sortase A